MQIAEMQVLFSVLKKYCCFHTNTIKIKLQLRFDNLARDFNVHANFFFLFFTDTKFFPSEKQARERMSFLVLFSSPLRACGPFILLSAFLPPFPSSSNLICPFYWPIVTPEWIQ